MTANLFGLNRPIIPISKQGAEIAAAQQQSAAVKEQFANIQDHMQLQPLMATAAFETDANGWVREGTKKTLFIDNEGQSQSSGTMQHRGNSSFGGGRTGDEDWLLDGLGIYVRKQGPRDFALQDRTQIRWSSHIVWKRAENEQSIGNLALWPAGSEAYFDYRSLRMFKEKIPIPARKHLSMKVEIVEDFQLSQPGRFFVHTIFIGTRSVSPVDRAGA